MKTLLKSVIIICTMAVTSFATAASFTVKESSKTSVFDVHYKNGQKGKVEISILNYKNEVVLTDEINSNGAFIRPYNFGSMPYGNYTIIIKDAANEYRENISYTEEKLVSYTYMAALPNQENKFWLNVRNNREEKLNVRILTQDGHLLYENSVVVAGAFNTVFNLSKIKRNTPVVFEVTNGNNEIHSTTFE